MPPRCTSIWKEAVHVSADPLDTERQTCDGKKRVEKKVELHERKKKRMAWCSLIMGRPPGGLPRSNSSRVTTALALDQRRQLCPYKAHPLIFFLQPEDEVHEQKREVQALGSKPERK